MSRSKRKRGRTLPALRSVEIELRMRRPARKEKKRLSRVPLDEPVKLTYFLNCDAFSPPSSFFLLRDNKKKKNLPRFLEGVRLTRFASRARPDLFFLEPENSPGIFSLHFRTLFTSSCVCAFFLPPFLFFLLPWNFSLGSRTSLTSTAAS